MRGKEKLIGIGEFDEGITPAYAGKRDFHPLKTTLLQGSPPPMRGKDFPVNWAGGYDRITPAYAGKS